MDSFIIYQNMIGPSAKSKYGLERLRNLGTVPDIPSRCLSYVHTTGTYIFDYIDRKGTANWTWQ